MAVKTFTQGEKLTAADTNTYLNNGGLVFVKQVTVGSAVSPIRLSVEGTISVNAGGTLIPRFAQNVSNGTASVVLAGSRMEVWQIA